MSKEKINVKIKIDIQPLLKKMKSGEKTLSELVSEKLQETVPWTTKN